MQLEAGGEILSFHRNFAVEKCWHELGCKARLKDSLADLKLDWIFERLLRKRLKAMK